MQLKRQLRRQTPAVLEVHFPPGFIDEDHYAVQHANTAIRTQLKQVWNKFCNHLMTGFSPTGDPTLPNIPNLQNLSQIMWRHLNPALAGTPDGEIDRLVSDPRIRVRYAFLQLGTLQNYYDPKSRNISQWLQIDRKLISNRTLAVDYINAWHQLIGAKDAELFGHEPMASKVDKAELVVPLDADVQEELAARGIVWPPVQ
ncbi:hypothetical protein PTTG_28697 [Puccinia triticina 1-1 BBBD Race 1]|uniref:Uncharacterized protein n=1 Tax=Puccinia triticina (isolate 1-1 / race 1 (BBBD)) TaxID=630390 RepID=A0A180G9U3_PUCT1|nr:hypothetical protein PTTG_28697 [Puccinia triticina 1-1 BBBD Race 1]